MDEQSVIDVIQNILSENSYELIQNRVISGPDLRFDGIAESADSVVIFEALSSRIDLAELLMETHGKIEKLKGFLSSRDVTKNIFHLAAILGGTEGSTWKAIEAIRHDTLVCRSIFAFISEIELKDSAVLKAYLTLELMPLLPLETKSLLGVPKGTDLLFEKFSHNVKATSLLSHFLADPTRGVHEWVATQVEEIRN